jgi:hypothetical protein
MSEATPKKRWGVEQRLEFIEFISFWEGAINRSKLVDHFGVSIPQASSDLSAYQQLAPQNLRYDLSSKRYVASEEFTCRLIRPDADRYLGQLTALTTHVVEPEDAWLSNAPVADVIPIPMRRVDPEILRNVLKVIRAKRSIEIEYQSMNAATPDIAWRRITPHAFASDGFRWHVRAFCHRDGKFKDFLLSRCTGTRNESDAGASADDDLQWSSYFDVVLTPNPRLSASQKKAIELDYAMQDGQTTLRVRHALLYYFNKRLRHDLAPQNGIKLEQDARETPVVVANLADYEEVLVTGGARARAGHKYG